VHSEEIAVSRVRAGSGLEGHLRAGDAILAVDDCPVSLPLPFLSSDHAPTSRGEEGGTDRWAGCLRDIAAAARRPSAQTPQLPHWQARPGTAAAHVPLALPSSPRLAG
jgi:hypothetical protein